MLNDDELEILRGRTSNPETLKAIAAMDYRNDWIGKLASIIPDTRVWPIVASIVETQRVKTGEGHTLNDLMGCSPRYYPPNRRSRYATGQYEKCVTINEIGLSKEGWEKAKPLVQQALDALNVTFVAGWSGLVCRLGEHRVERVWTLPDGTDLREFESSHGATGLAGACSILFPYIDWTYLHNLPVREEIVCVDGLSQCGECRRPYRPKSPDLEKRITAIPEVMERWRNRR